MRKYLVAIAIWALIFPFAIVNGILRDEVLDGLGDFALPLSGVILSAIILVIALFLIPKIEDCRPRDDVFFGII